ncbi:MAG: hypothetical protein U0821_02500 [Chloroflexota bacterium]
MRPPVASTTNAAVVDMVVALPVTALSPPAAWAQSGRSFKPGFQMWHSAIPDDAGLGSFQDGTFRAGLMRFGVGHLFEFPLPVQGNFDNVTVTER